MGGGGGQYKGVVCMKQWLPEQLSTLGCKSVAMGDGVAFPSRVEGKGGGCTTCGSFLSALALKFRGMMMKTQNLFDYRRMYVCVTGVDFRGLLLMCAVLRK